MAAVHELLEKTWIREGIQRVQFIRESDKTYHKGQILMHDLKKCKKSKTTVIFCVDGTIYVDDKAVLFVSRRELCKGLSLIQNIFK